MAHKGCHRARTHGRGSAAPMRRAMGRGSAAPVPGAHGWGVAQPRCRPAQGDWAWPSREARTDGGVGCCRAASGTWWLVESDAVDAPHVQADDKPARRSSGGRSRPRLACRRTRCAWRAARGWRRRLARRRPRTNRARRGHGDHGRFVRPDGVKSHRRQGEGRARLPQARTSVGRRHRPPMVFRRCPTRTAPASYWPWTPRLRRSAGRRCAGLLAASGPF